MLMNSAPKVNEGARMSSCNSHACESDFTMIGEECDRLLASFNADVNNF